MASTFSTNLKIELQTTGENSGTWGTITNTNLGTALEQAIVGYGNPSYASDANLTLTYTDTNAAQTARALVLNVTSAVSLTGTRELVVPTIQKQYIVQNNTTGSQSITVKTSGGTGVTVPNGRKAHLYVNGTDVIYMDDYVDINGGAIDGTPIGANSASTGAFTTLAASGNVTLSGGTANGVLYLNGSKVATSGSALTFDGNTLKSDTASTTVDNFRIENGSLNRVMGMRLVSSGVQFDAFDQNNSASQRSFLWLSGGSEQMRLTYTGLGIGTSSPETKLHVEGSSGSGVIQIGRDTGAAQYQYVNFGGNTTGDDAWQIGRSSNSGGLGGDGAFYLFDLKNNATRLSVTTSGNLGLGVTPSAWISGSASLDIRSTSAYADVGGSTTIANNSYRDSGGGWVYKTTNYASKLETDTGQFRWFTAPSGTAGNAISFTQAMTLDSSGNLGVGTTSPAHRLQVETASATGNIVGYFRQGSGAVAAILSTTDLVGFGNGATAGETRIYADGASGLVTFRTNNTERARITAGGYFKASNSGTYLSSTASYHEFYQSANAQALRVYASDSSTYNNDVLTVDGERTTTNSTYNLGNFRNGNGTGQCIIRDSGNIVNTNSSYGAISDQKLKQDIVDAASQWDDIKGVRVRKFRYKTDSTAPLQIGVIAQELEQVSPGLVDEAPDYEEVEVTDEEGNVTTERQPTGTSTKSVKYSILYMKAVKALQEAMARIEQLEADMAALKASA